ncbi:uncharacterized protein [Epargyreus clarus]|uniref:uncharacterized protein n=1 Tax=Epargyreus clarus TaxID=520877 RepID=UPI003C2D3A6A
MLISGVSEEEGRAGPGAAQDASEYRTADELFELMARDHSYDINGEQSLSTGDLVILYKNIDVGTKLMSDANDLQRKAPNQHVETVVYKDDRESEDSDVSEIYSNEDLQDVFLINNERIDLINNMSSIQHTLCHKFGDIKIQPPNLTTEYDRQFLFKDPYIKQQLKNINIPECMGFETMLPASLLDYICCKRLEDNYNFYMDNIIKYVQHTIEQLKRISNGDYLTDKAKQKWREVANDLKIPSPDAAKVLATSVSIPLHVEGKVNGHRSTWDDIVHSEVDVRSLSKILEKKIIIEVPKLICGSYKLFSGRCADNLIISCKKDLNLDDTPDKEEKPRVDVVFQLKRSDSGHVISNINSIMILQKIPSIATSEPNGLQYQENEEKRVKIIEINEDDDEELPSVGAINLSQSLSLSNKSESSEATSIYFNSTQSSIIDKSLLKQKVSMEALKTNTDFTLMTPDELQCTMQKLSMLTPLFEESEEASLTKKKSPTRVRIKSPYENQSHFMEEKKRKKLLEIREKKRKIALGENCKITKHKYGKGAVMAQPSSSVTKLSISNKSFYNSIYGETVNHDQNVSKKSRKWQKKETDIRKDDNENEFVKASFIGLDKSSFDDGTTETVMQMQRHFYEETYPTQNLSNYDSPLSNYDTNVNLFSHLIESSGSDTSISEGDSIPIQNTNRNKEKYQESKESDEHRMDLVTSQSGCNLVPENTPKTNGLSNTHQNDLKKTTTPVECRKSIDKIYDLMKKLGKLDEDEILNSTRQASNNSENIHLVAGRRSSTIQASDSGTSVKHHVISSNPSSFSFEKSNTPGKHAIKDKKRKEAPVAIVPKVIISSKLQKVDTDRNKTDRKRNIASPSPQNPKNPDNPLKAISQLLHEFDNVQKTRHKTQRKTDLVLADGRTISRQGSSKKQRHEQVKDPTPISARFLPSKERRPRPYQIIDSPQFPHQATYTDEKHVSKTAKRNLADIIDEAKEARGEAVRGPSKPFSRLNTLAQPKKSYIQAHNEEYQNKYGRNIPTYRAQRSTTSTPLVEKTTGNTLARYKRKGPDTLPVPLGKPAASTVPPIEKNIRPRRSASNSPARKRATQPPAESSCRQSMIPETPENLKKKMVAVESYVNSHYGPIDTSQLIGHEVHKSRVPLIPNDIELASMTSSPIAEESTALGNKLHHMIDTMINSNVPCLSVLQECKESTSKSSNDGLQKMSTDSLLKTEEPISESDYPVDIFEDKNIVTAVASISKDKILEDNIVDGNIGSVDSVTYDVQPFNSATELRKLENALYQKISVGAFPKRLRIKNLTLTPKQSLQQVIVVQSGDAGSLLVKSSLSQSLKTNDSKTESLSALKPLAALSNTHINWGFTNIPMQVATIGYAFPTYHSVQSSTMTPCLKMLNKNVDESEEELPLNENIDKNASKFHKTSQCFKGLYTEFCLEQATQANIAESNPSIDNVNINTVEENKNIKVQPEQLTNEEIDKVEDIPAISKAPHNSEGLLKQETASNPSENIDHSTSLDILMGLLNEIRKITGEAYDKNTDDAKEYKSQCKELEIILSNAATQESSVDNNYRDLVCTSSLDKLKQIDSHSSLYSLKMTKDEHRLEILDIENNITKKASLTFYKPQNMDKEVNVDFEKRYTNKLTDVPSCFLSLTINHGTNVTDSVINIKREPSTHSIYSFAEYETLYSNAAFNKVLELPKIETSTKVVTNLGIENEPEVLKGNSNDLDHLNDKKEDGFPHGQSEATKMEELTVIGNRFHRANKVPSTNTCFQMEPDFDHVMKMKRGMLVTLYSILVFTVFAALSFPKVFFHTEIYEEEMYN